MIVWLDAQLPPSLAAWLKTELDLDAKPVRDLGLRDAADLEIFHAARAASVVLISKDYDFVDLIGRLGTPPQLIWLTCGNSSNERLQSLCKKALPAALRMITNGEPIVEIAGSD